MEVRKLSILHVPADLVYLAAIQAFINELARLAEFSQKDITFFSVAVEEAVTNVVKHAFLPDQEEHFDVICELTPIEFKVIIRDKGLPFDPNRVEDFSAEQSLDGNDQAGLGFRLMKGSVDKLSFHNLGFGGKEVQLIKFIDQKHIDEYLKASQMEAFDQPEFVEKKELVKIPFHPMLLQPNQAVEISQCAYRAYGYTYLMENIYYPERLIEMNKTGELISAVAASDENNEVLGHVALEFFGRKKKIPELGMAFTKPKFRRQGCMTHLSEFLDQQALEKGVKGIYADAVTVHPYSQKALLSCGYKSAGIRIGLDPPRNFKSMENQCTQRETLVLMYKMLITQDVEVLVPVHHKGIIEKIYKNIGIKAEVHTLRNVDEDTNKMAQSDVEVDVVESARIASFIVNSVGENFQEEIKYRLRDLCLKKIEVIDLRLDMCNNNLVKCVPQLEMLGFFFSGVLPDDDKQYLLLQYLNNVPIDYSKIVLVSDFAQELGKYVKECDPNQK